MKDAFSQSVYVMLDVALLGKTVSWVVRESLTHTFVWAWESVACWEVNGFFSMSCSA